MVYLYTHWAGSELAQDVKEALKKRWRWDDESYLTRIIFDVMTKHNQGSETGYGIATYRPDNEHSIVVVNPEKQTVGFAREDEEPKCYEEWSFKEYITLDDEEIEKAFNAGR